jgi:hypothetical protein
MSSSSTGLNCGKRPYGTSIELARVRVEAAQEQDFIAKRGPAIDAVKEYLPGFVHAQLIKLGGGVWVDLVVWESREQALSAEDKVMGLPSFADWAQHIAEVIALEHAEIVHEVTTP